MTHNTLKNFCFYLLLIIGVSLHAQTARKYSNEFMNIGVDAASFGMANSIVASTDNVNAAYWNPAGLMQLKEREIGLMHAAYFANIANYDYAAYAMPIDEKSAFALSLIRFGVDDIMNTTDLIDKNGNIDYNRISLFSTADYSVTFSYARETPIENLHFGANAKIIRRVIGKFADSWGFGFDLGVQYKYSDWQFGLMVRDITTTFNTWSIDKKRLEDIQDAVEGENQDVPESTEITLPKAQLGVARNFKLSEDFSFLTEANLHIRFTETNDIVSSSFASLTPSLGLQLSYTDLVYVRTGIGNFQDELQIDGGERVSFQPNIGIGFHYKGISIDYALTDIGDQSAALYSNVFSLRLDLSIFK